MNLFLKIFLWFLLANALMIGIVVFINWSIQTEPVVSRWQISVRNQMTIYANTAGQIYDNEGDTGLRQFLKRVKDSETISEVDLIGQDGSIWMADNLNTLDYKDLSERAFLSDEVELDTNLPDTTALAAKKFTLKNGQSFALLLRWERPHPVAFFGESRYRYIRLGGLLLTALGVCFALARYLSSPIGKIRRATQKLAKGDLSTRVADEVGRRRDELAALALDFDVMAERLESLVTSQQRLTRDVSHELRSPLARMNVALEIAKQKSNGDASPLLERIEIESLRLNEMISRLLALSKLESGSTDVEYQAIDLRELVEQVASDGDFEARAKEKSVVFNGLQSCTVSGNEGLLRSAIDNVLRNAVRYTKQGTAVEISLKMISGEAVIEILDHGGGVPENELSNLFRPFYRVGEARERKTGGIGLGLAIAERAIKAHNGKIEAKNQGDGLLVKIVLNCRN